LPCRSRGAAWRCFDVVFSQPSPRHTPNRRQKWLRVAHNPQTTSPHDSLQGAPRNQVHTTPELAPDSTYYGVLQASKTHQLLVPMRTPHTLRVLTNHTPSTPTPFVGCPAPPTCALCGNRALCLPRLQLSPTHPFWSLSVETNPFITPNRMLHHLANAHQYPFILSQVGGHETRQD
jgi:hypothetical protein